MAGSDESVQEKTTGKPEYSEVTVSTVRVPLSNFFSTGLPPSGLPSFMVTPKTPNGKKDSIPSKQSSYICEETPAEKTSHGLPITQTAPAIFQQFQKRPQAPERSTSPEFKK